MMATKAKELRPVMTRLPESLRRRLEATAKRNGRSMNAEIIHRLHSSLARDSLQGVTTTPIQHLVNEVTLALARLNEAIATKEAGEILSKEGEDK
jgi:hypothetical protein